MTTTEAQPEGKKTLPRMQQRYREKVFDALKQEFGYCPRYTSREVFELYQHGRDQQS